MNARKRDNIVIFFALKQPIDVKSGEGGKEGDKGEIFELVVIQ